MPTDNTIGTVALPYTYVDTLNGTTTIDPQYFTYTGIPATQITYDHPITQSEYEARTESLIKRIYEVIKEATRIDISEAEFINLLKGYY